MIVEKVWKLTNTVRVGLDPRSSHTQRQTTFPDECVLLLPPLSRCVALKIWLLFVFLEFFWPPKKLLVQMGKRDEQTNTGEGGKGKRVRTTSDDGSSVVWDLYRLTCSGSFWTPPWLTWCWLNKHLQSSWKRSTNRTHTHTTHKHTLPTHPLTHPYIYIFLCVSHTDTLEVLLQLQHLIPYPSLTNYQTLLISGLCW